MDLRFNQIGEDGARALAGALASGNCPSGLHLNLCSNRISDEGAQAIAEALSSGHCPSGLLVDLIVNEIGDEGAQALAEALASGSCPSELLLNLCDNRISDESAQVLASALELGNCPSGLHLSLGGNYISDKGAQALAKALMTGNCPLGFYLVLSGNEIAHEGAQALAEALKSGKCRFGTVIGLYAKEYDFRELCKRNDFITHQAALGIATLIGGFSLGNCREKASPLSRLPTEIMDHIAQFLPGGISANKIVAYLKKSFHHLMKTHMEYSHKMRCKNEVNQRLYDKQYGLSLWKCREDYRTQYLDSHPTMIKPRMSR